LGDLFYVIHRTRSVEQQNAWTARLWIINEFWIREWYLIRQFFYWVVFHIVINILKTGPRRPNIRKTFQKSVALKSDLNYLAASSIQHRNLLLPASRKLQQFSSHSGIQVNDDFEALAQARLRLSARLFVNFAPLRVSRHCGPGSRKGAKAQSSQRFSLNTQIRQPAVKD